MSQTLDNKETRLAISVPEAGRLLGLGRNAAYEAAQRGEIPTLRFGRRLVVPISALEKLLDLSTRQDRASSL